MSGNSIITGNLIRNKYQAVFYKVNDLKIAFHQPSVPFSQMHQIFLILAHVGIDDQTICPVQ